MTPTARRDKAHGRIGRSYSATSTTVTDSVADQDPEVEWRRRGKPGQRSEPERELRIEAGSTADQARSQRREGTTQSNSHLGGHARRWLFL